MGVRHPWSEQEDRSGYQAEPYDQRYRRPGKEKRWR
jgi:hypothetical protein